MVSTATVPGHHHHTRDSTMAWTRPGLSSWGLQMCQAGRVPLGLIRTPSLPTFSKKGIVIFHETERTREFEREGLAGGLEGWSQDGAWSGWVHTSLVSPLPRKRPAYPGPLGGP